MGTMGLWHVLEQFSMCSTCEDRWLLMKILGDQTEHFFKPSQLGYVAIDSLNLVFVLGQQNSDRGRLKINQSDVPSLAAKGCRIPGEKHFGF